jgi:hypothetical protein
VIFTIHNTLDFTIIWAFIPHYRAGEKHKTLATFVAKHQGSLSERATGFEPVTFSLARRRSTTEPRPQSLGKYKTVRELAQEPTRYVLRWDLWDTQTVFPTLHMQKPGVREPP